MGKYQGPTLLFGQTQVGDHRGEENLEALTTDMINEIVTGMNQIDAVASRVFGIALENKGSVAVLLQSLSRFKYAR
jgi:hypothetical protein